VSSPVEALVDHYLLEFGSAEWAHAFHRLVELGPVALPFLRSRFDEARDPALRAEIVIVAQQWHSADALALFAQALEDGRPPVWKAALDGLVDLATPQACAVLERALSAPRPQGRAADDFEAWLREALAQVREALRDPEAEP